MCLFFLHKFIKSTSSVETFVFVIASSQSYFRLNHIISYIIPSACIEDLKLIISRFSVVYTFNISSLNRVALFVSILFLGVFVRIAFSSCFRMTTESYAFEIAMFLLLEMNLTL